MAKSAPPITHTAHCPKMLAITFIRASHYKVQITGLNWRSKMSVSEEKAEILEILRKNRIESLWHFTDIRNLPNILKLGGLRSKEYLEENRCWGKNFLFPGGDRISHNLDRKLKNWNKISLNFKPNTPLAYIKKREKHLVFIEINPRIATFEGVYFTDCNATRTRNKQRREEGIKGLNYVNFDMINSPSKPWDQDWEKYVQAEVLVPHHVPIDMFRAVHFISNASKEYGEFLCRKKCDFFCVKPEAFYDYYSYNRGSIQFPYLKEIFISTKNVPKEKVYAIKSNDPCIVGGELFWVIVHLHAIAGTRVSISIESIRKKREKEIKSDTDGIWWKGFTAPKGLRVLEVKVYIDTILWAHRVVRCMEMR
jgi:hypothetical protein